MPVTISDSLAHLRVLVTGGSKGTGAAIAGRLTEGGATVMTTARTMPVGYPDPGLFVAADISTPGGAQHVIDQVRPALRRPGHPGPHCRRLAREPRRLRRTQRQAVAG